MLERFDHRPMLTAALAIATIVLVVVVVTLATLLVTLQPAAKLFPRTVNGCALAAPVTGFGFTPVTVGVAAGAPTVKLNWPDEAPPGLMTSTLQLCAAVVKLGLMTI